MTGIAATGIPGGLEHVLEGGQNARWAGVTPPKELSLAANRFVDGCAVNISGPDDGADTFPLLKKGIEIRVEGTFSLERLLAGLLDSR